MNSVRIENIKRVLKGHSIGTYLTNGRLLAEDAWVDSRRVSHCDLIDVTDWSMPQVMRWLGY